MDTTEEVFEDSFVELEPSGYRKLKRALDITIAAGALIALSPLLGAVAVGIKMDSDGPIIFKQKRVGKDGTFFNFLKFRSMTTSGGVSQDKKREEMAAKGVLYKSAGDARITRIGRVIRKSSIDELPQLINVLRGDMSIVGPRPLVPFMLKPYPAFTQRRCTVRPGLTGLWQIRARHLNTSAMHMKEHDLEYIEKLSLSQDLKIIIQTVPAVLSAKGAK